MRMRLFVVLVLLASPAATLRAGAQTAEIQAIVDAMLAEAKPAPKSADKSEAKPWIVGDAKPAPKGIAKAEAKPFLVPVVIDYEDFVFVANDRPVLMRLHLRNGGRSYSASWDDYMKKFFDHFDRNHDGTLDKKEAERAPNMQFLQFQLQGNIGFPYEGQTIQMQMMDTNKDNKVTPAEFADYYRRSGFGPLQFFNSSNRASTDAVTNTLYKHLDTNKDGKLSAEELAKAPALLRRLDLDEDEMLTTQELSADRGNNNGYVVAPPGSRTMGGPNADLGFLAIKPATMNNVAQQVLAHYDKDKNGKLSRAEIGLDKALFDRLDANRDSQLDAKEFAGFFRRDADLELVGRIGKLAAKEGLLSSIVRGIGKEFGSTSMQPIRAEVFNPSKRAMPLAAKIQRQDPSALGFALGDSRIELTVSDQSFGQFTNIKQFYEQRFKEADTDKRDVIDRKQAKTVNFLDEIFLLLDRDGDGKLTLKELNGFLDMQVEGSSCQMQLGITDEGRSLFDVVDEDTDSRLSVRELRTGWTRMKPLAKSASGLARGDISRRLTVSVGQSQGRRFRTVVRNGVPVQKVGSAKAAPLWFSKMDRNNDGDLSPREFLGTEEHFRKLDADGDGLISAEEARQYEARLKK